MIYEFVTQSMSYGFFAHHCILTGMLSELFRIRIVCHVFKRRTKVCVLDAIFRSSNAKVAFHSKKPIRCIEFYKYANNDDRLHTMDVQPTVFGGAECSDTCDHIFVCVRQTADTNWLGKFNIVFNEMTNGQIIVSKHLLRTYHLSFFFSSRNRQVDKILLNRSLVADRKM